MVGRAPIERTLMLLVILLVALAGCGERAEQGQEVLLEARKEGSAMELTSKAFDDGERIPAQYTCEGEDLSPPLSIAGVGPEAESLALVVDDPDAPGGVFDHWAIWNLPADAKEIPEGLPREERVLDGAVQGRNDFGQLGYRGPCPPPGPKHRYRFKLYALEAKLVLPPGASVGQLEEAMEGHIIGQAMLTGRYAR